MKKKMFYAVITSIFAMMAVEGCAGRAKPQETEIVQEDESRTAQENETESASEETAAETEEEMTAAEGDTAAETESEIDINEYDQNGVHAVFENIPFEEMDENGNILMVGSYMTAQISIEGAMQAEAAMQQFFDENTERFLREKEECLEIAREDAGIRESMLETGMSYGMYESLQIADASERVISLLMYDEQFLGGAHGSHWTTAHNFDRQTGAELTFADLFEDADAAREEIKEAVTAQMQTMNEEAGEELFFPNAEEGLGEMLDAGFWYLKEGNLIVIANPYDLAPYAAGAFEFSVPLAELSGFLY